MDRKDVKDFTACLFSFYASPTVYRYDDEHDISDDAASLGITGSAISIVLLGSAAIEQYGVRGAAGMAGGLAVSHGISWLYERRRKKTMTLDRALD